VELSVLKTGDRAIGALILARDAETTYYISGGRDEALSREFANTAHYRMWLAMLRAREVGSKRFDLGAVLGSVGQYKLKFSPEVRTNPDPVTLILHRARYRLWKAMVVGNGLAGRARALVRRVGSLYARS
jgi:lipid II:glycine glycyltransferase (peptidoglycan interpeptide bridge formation enzyme)